MSSNEPDEVGSIDIGPGTIDPREFQVQPHSVEPEHYLAVLLLESTSDDPDHRPLYEESFVLVKAESEDEAREKAAGHGKELETSYEDEHHRPVTWRFKELVDVRALEDATFDDGTELFSRFFRDYAAYRALNTEEP